jgi:hypothetical protein
VTIEEINVNLLGSEDPFMSLAPKWYGEVVVVVSPNLVLGLDSIHQ